MGTYCFVSMQNDYLTNKYSFFYINFFSQIKVYVTLYNEQFGD